MLKEVLRRFELPLDSFSDQSIWPHSPVYLGELPVLGRVVLKQGKAGGLKAAEHLKKWQLDLNANSGVRVVHPVDLPVPNPQLVDGQVWVVYPFIDGKTFANTEDQIARAGEFLGKLHHYKPDTDHGFGRFDPREFGEDFLSEVQDDLKNLHDYVSRNGMEPNRVLLSELASYLTDTHAGLMSTELPMANATWDFKASNILFVDDEVVGIDLENAARLPRIVDLALALLLFNGDLDDDLCPPRCFTVDEWQIFLRGYRKHVSFEEVEIDNWRDVLRFVYADEAIWAVCESLNNLANASSRTSIFMTNLLDLDLSRYEISSDDC